jgi:hypothetical protein
MARYLVVAHQTAESEELIEHLHGRAAADPSAEFVLLVPATPVGHLLAWEEGESVEVAKRRADDAAGRLRERGIRITGAIAGDPSPLLAVDDELRRRPEYDGLIVSTLAPGVSRWLGLDVISRLRARVELPVSHVVAKKTGVPA